MTYLIYSVIFVVIIASLILAFFLNKHKSAKVLKVERNQEKPVIEEVKKKNVQEFTIINKKLEIKPSVVEKTEIKPDESAPENDEKEAIFEDFHLDDLTTDKNVFDLTKPKFNINNDKARSFSFDDDDDFNDDEDDVDDDFAEIEKTYQEFLNRRRNESRRSTYIQKKQAKSDYTFDNFKEDYFEKNVDVDEIIGKMTPEMKNVLLSKILERKDYDGDDFV